MKNLFRLLCLSVLMTLMVFSCDKSEEPRIDDSSGVYFDVANVTSQKADNMQLRSTFPVDDYPVCVDTLTAYRIHIKIDNVEYSIAMTDLGSNESEVLKLNAGTYTVTEFAVMAEDPLGGEDIALWVMPQGDSDAALTYGLTGLPFTFTVEPFIKTKEVVDVVCYEPGSYNLFGYTWFQYNTHTERELFFFGNMCTKFFDQFHIDEQGNPYANQYYEGYDFPAIFTVNVYRDGLLVGTATNADNYAVVPNVNEPLSVTYIDNDAVSNEQFDFEILLTMPDGSSELVYTGSFADGAQSIADDPNGFGGVDGIFDFVIGNCDTFGNNDADIVFPAWVPIPSSGQFQINGIYPASGGYTTISFQNLDFDNILTISSSVDLPGWCADQDSGIGLGVWYDANFYSSLGVNAPSISGISQANLNVLNWIVNQDLSAYSAQEVQEAIWQLLGTLAGSNSFHALASVNVNYTPTVGGYAVIFCDAIEQSTGAESFEPTIQLMVVSVDP